MQTTATMNATRLQDGHAPGAAILTGSSGLLTTGNEHHGTRRKSVNPQEKQPRTGSGPSISTLMFMKKQISNFHTRQKRGMRGSILRKTIVENSYRIEAPPAERYSLEGVQNIVHICLDFFLDGMHYEEKACAKVTKVISDDIKRKMRYHFNCPRYKIVVHTVVAERTDQGLEVASRCLSDDKKDNNATATYTKGNICGTATAFWVYYE